MRNNFKAFSAALAFAGLFVSVTTFADTTACNGFVPAVPTLAANSPEVESTVEYVLAGGTCTGTLINDMVGDQKPYILTAAHCLSEGAGITTAGGTVNITVNWLAYESGSITTATAAARATTVGAATVEAIYGDVALLLLPGVSPGGSYFSAVDATPVPSPTGSQATTFSAYVDHHAEGNSQQLMNGSATVQNTDSNGNALNYNLNSTNGAGAPGTSGSGLRKGNIGTGAPVIATASAGSGTAACTVLYTSIAPAWLGGGTPATSLQPWLDPNSTGLTAIPGTASTTPLPPTISLSASATSVQAGQPVTISWSSMNADTCTASGSDPNFSGNEQLNGSSTLIPPSGYQTYMLTCTNDKGQQSQTQSVSISVVPAGGSTSTGGSSGGGGALGLGLLIPLMGAAGVRRRKGAKAE